MIFVFNGPHKNASHYHMLIVQEAMKQVDIPFNFVGDYIFSEERLFKDKREPSKKLLDSLDQPIDEVQVCKTHWGLVWQRDLLLSYEQIRIFLIWRNLPDVLVSSYHYFQKVSGGDYSSFPDYYWRKGRAITYFQVVYRRNWELVFDNRVHQVKFEDLKLNFNKYSSEMLSTAGIEGVDLDILKEELTINRLREKHDDQEGFLFRRGNVGEHKATIPEDILDDIAWIESLSKRELYWHHFRYNPKVILNDKFEFVGQEKLLWLFEKTLLRGK